MRTSKFRKIEYIDINLIVPNNYNANTMPPELFDRLVEDINKNSILNPLHVFPLSDGRYMIIDGEHRYRAALVLNMVKVPVIIHDDLTLDMEEARKLMSLRLNVLHGDIDPAKFVLAYKEIVKKYGLEAFNTIVGFNPKVWKDLKDKAIKLLEESNLPPEVTKQVVKKIERAKTADQIAKIIDKIFNEYGIQLEQYGYVVFSDGRNNFLYIVVEISKFKEIAEKIEVLKNAGRNVSFVVDKLIEILNDIAHQTGDINQLKF